MQHDYKHNIFYSPHKFYDLHASLSKCKQYVYISHSLYLIEAAGLCIVKGILRPLLINVSVDEFAV